MCLQNEWCFCVAVFSDKDDPEIARRGGVFVFFVCGDDNDDDDRFGRCFVLYSLFNLFIAR